MSQSIKDLHVTLIIFNIKTLLSTGSNQEDRSLFNWKIVDGT